MLPSPSSPMHIPDGFLTAAVSLILWAVAIPVIAYALKRVERDLSQSKVPIMGVLAAAIFAGQMLNFAIAGGTSGHLLGSALATVLVGPWAAMMVMTTVVGVQALIFQDGGLFALGPNLFNLALVSVAVAFFTHSSVRRVISTEPVGTLIGGAAAAWLSTVIAALACAFELSISGASPANLVVPAMAAIHMLIGLVEAAITVGALSFLYAARRDLFAAGRAAPKGGAAVWAAGLAIAASLTVLSPFASAHPDGLEWIAGQQNFLESAQDPLYRLIPNYAFPGVSSQSLATILAGMLGVLLVLATLLGVTYKRRKRDM